MSTKAMSSAKTAKDKSAVHCAVYYERNYEELQKIKKTIDIQTDKLTVTINIIGMIAAVLLIVGMTVYTVINRDFGGGQKRFLIAIMGSALLLFLSLAIRLESEEKRIQYLKKTYQLLKIPALALLMVFTMECMSGSILMLSRRMLIANTVICMCLYLLVFILTNRLRFSLILVNCLLFVVAVANYCVMLFRNSPLLPFDIFSFHTAMTVLEKYEMKFNEGFIFGVFIFVTVLSSSCRMPFKIGKIKIRIAAFAGGAGFLIGMTAFFYGFLYPHWGLWYSTWRPIETYQQDGYLMTTMIFVKYATVPRPDGYSEKKAKEILASFEKAETEDTSSKPINLIVVMNESWSTLDYVKPVKTNIPYDPFYQSLSENTIKGNAYVSICGGNTVQTEYEFFTGNSVSGLPTGATAYEFFIKEDTENICHNLKQEGYGCYAIHPFDAGSYQRDKAYEKFGFKKFITIKKFKGYEIIRDFYSDAATYEKVIELYEDKEPGEKLFIWDLTMQNHGGYGTSEGFEDRVCLTDYPELEQASTYLSLMKCTDKALEKLITYFSKEEEPTMIVMFGDHQPVFTDGTYDVLYGKAEDEVGEEEREKRYITPFLIWNNYGLQEEYIEQMSSNYLSSYMFEKAGLPLTSYQKLLLDLYQSYPVINVEGIYDAQGTYWSWDDVADSPDYEKLHNYQIVQYYMMKKSN